MPRSADQPEQREDKLDDSGFEALATCPAQAERSSQYLYRALADPQLHECQQQQQQQLLLLLFLYSACGRVYAAHRTMVPYTNLLVVVAVVVVVVVVVV